MRNWLVLPHFNSTCEIRLICHTWYKHAKLACFTTLNPTCEMDPFHDNPNRHPILGCFTNQFFIHATSDINMWIWGNSMLKAYSCKICLFCKIKLYLCENKQFYHNWFQAAKLGWNRTGTYIHAKLTCFCRTCFNVWNWGISQVSVYSCENRQIFKGVLYLCENSLFYKGRHESVCLEWRTHMDDIDIDAKLARFTRRVYIDAKTARFIRVVFGGWNTSGRCTHVYSCEIGLVCHNRSTKRNGWVLQQVKNPAEQCCFPCS